MARVLITALGRGREVGLKILDNYSRANYSYGDESFNSPYVAEAMKKIFKTEKIIFLGTTGSDWASLYQYIFLKDNNLLKSPGAVLDEEVADKLEQLSLIGTEYDKDKAEGNNIVYYHDMEPDSIRPLLNGLKTALDQCLDIILLRYGTNEQELKENLQALEKMDSLLNDGDD